MTRQTPGEWLRANWPIVAGVCASLVLAAQLFFQLGSVEAKFSHSVIDATEQRDEMAQAHDMLAERIRIHEDRAAHEHTAIRLERIEVNQQIMGRDINRVQVQLDTIATDLKKSLTKDHAHARTSIIE